ncbi:hypothetical protein GR925_01710 [Streptomyces sp. HUCO-GS316]|uniref:SMP-30/gluconolactonase/LRE family protein n=1 Tax=Streptomyces sp. HUCO-GS316 TaxID=2692198 RepID=UPI00136CF15E|nr:SMP-30/gluconolactonase/LRE family protein [Streptomyces sp. HUCO-GS316]MXM62198.1 hypothetical protein [Streptomyces sp. HUCO-GS316]
MAGPPVDVVGPRLSGRFAGELRLLVLEDALPDLQQPTPWWQSGQADGSAVDAEGAVWVALGTGGAVARVLHNGTLPN